jgi:DNA-binding NarL/FixJ family response regulator
MPTRIILADDHTLVREGVRTLIEARLPGAEVVAEASSGAGTVALCRQHQPDLLMLDISMPDRGGLDVLPEIKEVSPATRTVIVSQYSDRAYVIRALRLGAKAYLPKKVMGKDLIAALESVLAGGTYLHPSVADLVVDAAVGARGAGEAGELALLTDREREVLRLIAEGKTTKEVAQVLGISIHTANRHRANLMEKLGAHSGTGIVKLAVRLKLVEV